MSGEISQTLESYIHQEQRLLTQLSQIQGQRQDIRTELGKDAVRLGVREILGRTGGKYARKLMERAERERIRNQETQIDSQHRGNIQRIRGFLGTVSEWKKNLKEPNSDRLISRLDRAQSGAKVATRIRHTITLLMNLKTKRLVYNKTLPLTSNRGSSSSREPLQGPHGTQKSSKFSHWICENMRYICEYQNPRHPVLDSRRFTDKAPYGKYWWKKKSAYLSESM